MKSSNYICLSELLEKSSRGNQEVLNQQLDGKKPQEQQEIVGKYLKSHYTVKEIQEKYAVEVAQKVIPDYIRTLLEAATEEQKQKVKTLLESVTPE